MSRTLRTAPLIVSAALLAVAPGAALAQKNKKKKEPAGAAAAPAAPAAPAGPPPPTAEQKKQASAEFQAGQESEKGADFDGAIAHYQKAFDIYPDPVLELTLGEAHRKKADQAFQGQGYDQAVTEYEAAKAAYEKYLELAPQGKEAEAARNRVTVVTTQLADARAAQEKQKAEEKKQADEEAAAQKRAEQDRQREQSEGNGTNLALDGMVGFGMYQDATALGRIMGGALLGWGRFALEGHLAFEGFLRGNDSKGVSARSITLADLGARYGFTSARFVGPFVSAGGGFGLFFGKPRERRLTDDMATCEGYDTSEAGQCGFAIDKNISTRLGFGYGFNASPKATVVARLDAMLWFYSVDDEQDVGDPPAGAVDKPQSSLALVLGLEFLHWP